MFSFWARTRKSFESKIDTTGDVNAQKAKDSLETYKVKRAQQEEEKKNLEYIWL